MPDVLISALVQAPFVLVVAYLTQRFLVYVKDRDEMWQAFTKRMGDRMAAHLDELTGAVTRLNQAVATHDAVVQGILRGSQQCKHYDTEQPERP